MEHIIASTMMSHFDTNDVLYDMQHGFRQGRSCETQLLSLVDDLAANRNNGIQTDMVLMDFAKAFDKVPHCRLIHKLEHYCVRGKPLTWIQAFLTGRTQRVVLEGECSDSVPVSSGVPQGTVLRPILFLAYINDLPNHAAHAKVRLFADDCILQTAVREPQDCVNLQHDIDNICSWEKTWLMQFNPSKCEVMSIPASKTPICYDYTLHDTIMNKVSKAKYLGLTISANLSWNCHVDNVSAKANRTLGMLRRSLRIASVEAKGRAYMALVRPSLEYASSVWDPHTADQVSRVEAVQRRAARYVCNNYKRTASVTAMISDLEWQPLSYRRKTARLTTMFKILHNTISVPHTSSLVPAARCSRRTNHAFKLQTIACKTNYYRLSFFPRTIKEWNELEPSVAEAESLSQFKAELGRASLH
ncbi:Hypp6507 [Branchiostoma lanceolatum]|uniref:Hypp6507 protein n=1 Tax=Branchiostoma lanceolatum TaxID=7740 RepID=A0A8J9YV37_BRALA|nr:Hypp6507 [Branchiostoma lanceolatum]